MQDPETAIESPLLGQNSGDVFSGNPETNSAAPEDKTSGVLEPRTEQNNLDSSSLVSEEAREDTSDKFTEANEPLTTEDNPDVGGEDKTAVKVSGKLKKTNDTDDEVLDPNLIDPNNDASNVPSTSNEGAVEITERKEEVVTTAEKEETTTTSTSTSTTTTTPTTTSTTTTTTTAPPTTTTTEPPPPPTRAPTKATDPPETDGGGVIVDTEGEPPYEIVTSPPGNSSIFGEYNWLLVRTPYSS